jgi:glycosyltransferase involved in cell wall biosynthesis
MSTPAVSVLLPVWNAATTVARAVESIRSQTFGDWELLAVDDGSTDATPRMLAELARDEPRLRVLTRAHGGLVPALNAGLAAARGELVARMDADDESLPERLAAQVALLRAHPETGVAGSLVEFGGDPRAAAGYALHVEWLNTLRTPEEIALHRFEESPFAHPSVMFRRELVPRHGGYREGDFPEDYELWLRWLEAGVRLAKVPQVLLRWHDPPGRLSRTDARYDAEAFFRCKAGFLARWLRDHVDPERRLLVWGAGRPTRRRVDWLRRAGAVVAGYVDIDPRKVGRRLDGVEVIAPEQLPERRSVFVLGYVAARGGRELARTRLARRGFSEGADFLFAA